MESVPAVVFPCQYEPAHRAVKMIRMTVDTSSVLIRPKQEAVSALVVQSDIQGNVVAQEAKGRFS